MQTYQPTRTHPPTHTHTHTALTTTQCKNHTTLLTHTHTNTHTHIQTHTHTHTHTLTPPHTHSASQTPHTHTNTKSRPIGSSRFKLVRLRSQRVLITTTVFLVPASTINTTAAIRKPPNYVRYAKNRRRRDNLLSCRCLQPSTSVPLVTSRRTAESPVLMTSLITKRQILATKSSKFSPMQVLLATKSAMKLLY